MDLGVVEQFLNTLDERTFSVHGEKHEPSDALTSVEALSSWLQTYGLATPDQRLRPRDLRTAISLRTTLRGDGEEPSSFPLQLKAGPEGRLRVTADSGVPGLDAILETVATSVADGSWNRLKLCASDDCHWAFYDTSRSGGGRWCSMEVCGNRHKTRAYRRRRPA